MSVEQKTFNSGDYVSFVKDGEEVNGKIISFKQDKPGFVIVEVPVDKREYSHTFQREMSVIFDYLTVSVEILKRAF